MDRGTYHRARGLFGFGYRAINHRSGRPEGAKGDSPGQSEAPPWVRRRMDFRAVESRPFRAGLYFNVRAHRALPWAFTLRPVGAAESMVDRAITKAEQPKRSVVRSAVHGLPVF